MKWDSNVPKYFFKNISEAYMKKMLIFLTSGCHTYFSGALK